jgi:hypothetical protein
MKYARNTVFISMGKRPRHTTMNYILIPIMGEMGPGGMLS